MAFEFNLSSEIRDTMVKEIINAQKSGNFFYSKKLNSTGEAQIIEVLTDAATAYDEHWMAFEMEQRALMKSFDARTEALVEYSTSHIPDSASAAYSENQFNRFYMIALCHAASLQGKTVTVFKAQAGASVKPQSTKLIGKIYNAEALKAELRSMKISLTHELLMPNAGLSVRISDSVKT